MKILQIGDTQVKPGVDLSYLFWIGQYIVDKKPDVVVHIGDHWDMPSLSPYDKGKKSFEGRRVLRDIQAGNEGMEAILLPLKMYNSNRRAQKKSQYNPRLVFTTGNHENRIQRLTDDVPELDGMISYDNLHLNDWEVYDFLYPVDIEGISFVHFLANPFSGRPYGGTVLNQLKHVGKSFVCGHKQVLDMVMKPTLDGRMQIGIINGACYLHDEGYKGPQGNNHFRGLVMLNEVEDGFGLPIPVSLKYLGKRYGNVG